MDNSHFRDQKEIRVTQAAKVPKVTKDFKDQWDYKDPLVQPVLQDLKAQVVLKEFKVKEDLKVQKETQVTHSKLLQN